MVGILQVLMFGSGDSKHENAFATFKFQNFYDACNQWKTRPCAKHVNSIWTKQILPDPPSTSWDLEQRLCINSDLTPFIFLPNENVTPNAPYWRVPCCLTVQLDIYSAMLSGGEHLI
ncbi:hypothetical protein MIND_00269900 [Mycena indigotica]|uniref:Uncharacterized protein n=1 Tax=Mycena indigotica TaxID=2126181 RepID=A0A8H6T870_9AGAR|nr:uncharacterized protein MIND_00269900 [Mycena indigotica]KAF7312559.1 hypothetical protein MIND_00269900 [Mycena indigotica]